MMHPKHGEEKDQIVKVGEPFLLTTRPPFMCRTKGQSKLKQKEFEGEDRYTNALKRIQYGYNIESDKKICGQFENQECVFTQNFYPDEGSHGPIARFIYKNTMYCYDVKKLVHYFKAEKDKYDKTGPPLPGLKGAFLDNLQMARVARLYNDFVENRNNTQFARFFGGTTATDLTNVREAAAQQRAIHDYNIRLDILSIVSGVYNHVVSPEVGLKILHNYTKFGPKIKSGDAKMDEVVLKLVGYQLKIAKIPCKHMTSYLGDVFFGLTQFGVWTSAMHSAVNANCEWVGDDSANRRNEIWALSGLGVL